MSKLFKLKEWVTLDEAVVYLSKAINEPLTLADLYRFALDGKLKLSVNFVNAVNGVIGRWLKSDDIKDKGKFDLVQSSLNPEKSPKPNEMFVSNDDWIAWQAGIQTISGVWELTMRGDEPLDVKAHHQYILSGLGVIGSPINGHGILLQQDNVVCQLYKHFQIIKRGGLYWIKYEIPKANGDCKHMLQCHRASHIDDLDELELFHVLSFNKIRKNIEEGNFTPSIHLVEHEFSFVIGTSEITRFIETLADTPQEIKLSRSNERSPYLILIAALCKETNVDPKQRGIATSLIAMTQLIGAALNDDTIRKVLKQIEPITCSEGKRLAATMLTTHGKNTFLVLIDALFAEAKVDYKHKDITASLLEMTKSNSTPLTEDIISEIVSQIEPAICSKSK
jgi:hypothetical protein